MDTHYWTRLGLLNLLLVKGFGKWQADYTQVTQV